MLTGLLVTWFISLVALLRFTMRPGQNGALTLAYFAGLSLIHVPGIIPFLNVGPGLENAEVTESGFEITMVGIFSFVLGAILASQADRRCVVTVDGQGSQVVVGCTRSGWRMFAVGAFAYFGLLNLSFSVPSLTSIVSAFGTLIIIGLWVVIYSTVAAANHYRMIAILSFLPILPLATLAAGGYLGYGIYWLLSIIAFFFVFLQHRAWFYTFTPAAIFLGLSLFVTYMGQRSTIREAVWHERVGAVERLERVSTLVTDFQLIDLTSAKDLAFINDRLNQNSLVGAAVMRHQEGWWDFALGSTLMPWAIIPRAIWPEKPSVGGGGDVVSQFTGMRFKEGTSVGAGQVFEFYVNFGTLGVIAGFLVLGFSLMRLDRSILRALAAGDLRGLLLRAMPGLMLMQPGGNFTEIVVACVAAWLAAHLVLISKFCDISIRTTDSRRVA